MAAPVDRATREALEAVQDSSPQQLDQLISNEIGDPMLGAFNSLAKASFPGADEDLIAQVVHLMVVSYLMRCHVDGAI